MRDRDVFRQVETLRHRDATSSVSRPALEVHARAVARASESVRPSFVSDTDLDAIADPRVSTMAALELCLDGLWRRADDGYVITDVDYVADVLADAGRPRAWRTLSTLARRVWIELNSDRFIP
ncbi:hypothetical protein [Mycolicibacterium sediminis]|uniref:Uncharacterized protein n=1 Tax=Mycolicibacterium sediminis TaxID=1286180 RepID=A0A7I7QK42_9MYCO|nr:hypothetical protein [Mycolicibacterium sediminis]BBY26688.1 hypothetical protein MSEDJ_07840 [Mycolicibacterium sediminis]